MKTFHFLAGLPRSGSSLLSAILTQHKDVYVTPTSPMLDLLIANQHAWHNCPSVMANPVPEQLTNLTKGMINSAWSHINKPVIVDKNRGWNKNMPASTILFDKEIKVIAMVRDLPSIMASWLILMRNNPGNSVDITLRNTGRLITDESRIMEIWFNMVKDCMEGLVQLKVDAKNRLMIINYDDLINNTHHILHDVENFLQISAGNYDLCNITGNDNESAIWGMKDLHKVRTNVNKTAKSPKEVLGEKLYGDMIKLEKLYNENGSLYHM